MSAKLDQNALSPTDHYAVRNDLTDCDDWVSCKLWDICGICEINWTIFTDNERLV